jgi:hypothetical protein
VADSRSSGAGACGFSQPAWWRNAAFGGVVVESSE